MPILASDQKLEEAYDVHITDDRQDSAHGNEFPASEPLHRALSARHTSMLALGGTIGTGLIIGSGTGLVRGGPLGLVLSFAIVGAICFASMAALCEMAAYLPHSTGFPGYARRFVDPALGFALGWNYAFKYLIAPASNLNAACIAMQYWTLAVPIAGWDALYIMIVLCITLMGVRVFGELEFWLGSLKVLSLVAFILLGIIVDLGGNPQHDRIGFRYWRAPNGPMGTYLTKYTDNASLSAFLGFWSTLTTALYAYIGSELVGVTVGETRDPRRNVPRAIKRTFFRIAVFYVGNVFAISLIVPSTSHELFVANGSPAGAAASPFVVGVQLAGIRILNSVINAIVLVFTLSAANADVYIGSRTLYGMAVQGDAPRVLARVDRRGVPWTALLVVIAFTCLTFTNVSTSSAKVFAYFVNLLSAFGAITWMCILYTHIAFMRACHVQGISRASLPYAAPGQPYASWIALGATAVITVFKGFDTFLPWSPALFVTAYLPVALFLVLWAGYKIRFRSFVIPPERVDLAEKQGMAAEERNDKEPELAGSSWWRRFVDRL
ncbi:dicarbixylic amino acid permease [Coniophora puteana RWD-64-598 SS2]|uniref:Dicarbixylic amino acid permease n=1 Tax=Coniophora puteana (strain RWD-64-598) TaxID=741705 RepID=A0A5M3N1T1_CONPW|nr:dicarbixylic amino acid permease [Coniophora puteana RWD-64-598 SS2]EIW85227.1 dicarbixylic amino acid permease [Coniophora puteana RWD-64-598 SS2]